MVVCAEVQVNTVHCCRTGVEGELMPPFSLSLSDNGLGEPPSTIHPQMLRSIDRRKPLYNFTHTHSHPQRLKPIKEPDRLSYGGFIYSSDVTVLLVYDHLGIILVTFLSFHHTVTRRPAIIIQRNAPIYTL